MLFATSNPPARSTPHSRRTSTSGLTRLLPLAALAAIALASLPSPALQHTPAPTPIPTPAATAAPSPSPASLTLDHPPLAWLQAAVQLELPTITSDGMNPVRYRVHKIDSRGDFTREVIETRQGAVARLVALDGHPLTAAQDAAERQRLLESLHSPADFLRHHQRDAANRQHALALVRLMPSAMLYRYTPGQPQLPGQPDPQVVLDFTPDPHFHPPDMMADLLTGISGRLWIDARTQHLVRAQATVIRPVNFGWGFVGRLAPGGTVSLDQCALTNGLWLYSGLDEDLSLRALMVKNLQVKSSMTATSFRPLAALPDFQQAIRTLLAEPIPLR